MEFFDMLLADSIDFYISLNGKLASRFMKNV